MFSFRCVLLFGTLYHHLVMDDPYGKTYGQVFREQE